MNMENTKLDCQNSYEGRICYVKWILAVWKAVLRLEAGFRECWSRAVNGLVHIHDLFLQREQYVIMGVPTSDDVFKF